MDTTMACSPLMLQVDESSIDKSALHSTYVFLEVPRPRTVFCVLPPALTDRYLAIMLPLVSITSAANVDRFTIGDSSNNQPVDQGERRKKYTRKRASKLHPSTEEKTTRKPWEGKHKKQTVIKLLNGGPTASNAKLVATLAIISCSHPQE